MITVYPNLNHTAEAGTLYQWDYGQRLMIGGVTLPSQYEVHFCLDKSGTATCVTGDSTGCDIPDELLAEGKNINGWVYVTGENEGRTKYAFVILVEKRAKPSTPREPIKPAEGEKF